MTESPREGEIVVSLLDSGKLEVEESPKPLKRAGRVVGFVLLYFTLLLPLTDVALLLPTIALFTEDPTDTESLADDWIQEWPWSTFVVWVVCMMAGYTFVACITEQRTNPFKSRFDKYQCFVALIAKSPLVYVCGPVRALRGPAGPDTQLHTFTFNAVFVIFFFLGLQFTYLDSIMIFRKAGDKFGSPSLWKTYTRSELLFIFPIILLVVGCVAYHISLIVIHKLYIWFSVFYGIIFLAILMPTLLLRKTHYLHFHHYAIFGLLIPFFAFPNIFSLAWLGIVSGIYVEGISRWGMAWLWYPGAQREYS